MKQWSADYVNDPSDDYNLLVDIWYGDEHCGQIKSSKGNFEIIWFASDQVRNIPLDWFLGLLSEAKNTLKRPDE